MKNSDVVKNLEKVWIDFEEKLDTIPIISKINNGRLQPVDYKTILINHRQQVVEGSRWIARMASSIDSRYPELRSKFLKHSITEHKDYRMLEQNYVSMGGKIEDIQNAEKNIGTEALNAFMFHRASQPNPFDLLGAMFIIEGLGQKKAGIWGRAIRDQLNLDDSQVSFLLYHAEHDESHMQEFADALNSGILDIDGMGTSIVKTAKIVARLYCLQLEEIGNV